MDATSGGIQVTPGPRPSDEELVRDSEALRREQAWEEEPAAIEVRRPTREVVSFRLPTDEMDRLEDAASEAGVSISELVRRAVTAYLGSPVYRGPSLDRFDSSATRLVVRHWYGGSTTDTSDSDVRVPDFPPLTAQGLLRLPFEEQAT